MVKSKHKETVFAKMTALSGSIGRARIYTVVEILISQ